MYNKLFIWGLLLFTCFIQSCKEGCKDKTAINYDSKATAENGTCLYCTSSFASDSATYSFTCFNAPNPNVNSIAFILVTTKSSITGNGCKTEGKQTGSACNNYLRIVNLTNSSVEGNFSVEFFQNSVAAWSFQDQNFIVMGPPGSGTDTINFGLVDTTGCSNLRLGELVTNLNSLQFF